MAQPDRIPKKPSYKLSEVCQYTDTQPYVLRFWESEFPQLTPRRGPTGQPLYSRKDIDLVLQIKALLYEQEETIAGARELIESGSRGVAQTAPDAHDRPDDSPEPAETRGAAPAGPAADDDDVVERRRYEDALQEISHLRLQLKDLESRVRRAEATAEQARDAAATDRRRVEVAAERVRRLIESLDGPPA